MYYVLKMKILVDIGHPSHVHFFRNAIHELEKRGHKVKITARNKDTTLDLLDAYDLEYEYLGENQKNLAMKATNMLTSDYKLHKIAKKFKPDILTGFSSIYAAHIGKLIGKPAIIFTDTEHDKICNYMINKFATTICTPRCFKKDFGPKQEYYEGYKELAYLHPDYFKPNPEILESTDLENGEDFIVLRFVSWNAIHDRGHQGITNKKEVIEELKKYGRILITSETHLPNELKDYIIRLQPQKIHDLLYYAKMCVSEGATMATEAGILGTPTVYISSLCKTMGNFDELEKRYGLVYSHTNQNKGIETTKKILETKNSKKEWKKKRDRLLREKIDVTNWVVNFLEKYT